MKNERLIKIILFIFMVILVVTGLITVYLELITKAITNKISHRLPAEFIKFDKKIEYCEERKLNNKIILITSRYCKHCEEAITILFPLIKRYKLETYFRIYDVIDSNGLRVLNDLQISAPYVPILIIDCDAYLGLKDQKQYIKYLQNFKLKLEINSQKR